MNPSALGSCHCQNDEQFYRSLDAIAQPNNEYLFKTDNDIEMALRNVTIAFHSCLKAAFGEI